MAMVTDKQFYMDATLKAHIDSMCHDIPKDFDFIICISGDGMTRTGKTTLAQQIAYYMGHQLGYKLDVDGCSNFCFSGKELIEKAVKTTSSIFIYDEAMEDLDSKKSLDSISMNLQHFLAECGKLRHVIFVVLPDFFSLNRSIAITRSESLINVWLDKKEKDTEDGKILIRERGCFDYFTRNDKRKLWAVGKKNFHDYQTYPPSFHGHFSNVWLFNKESYEKRKDEFLQRNRDPLTLQKSPKIERFNQQRNCLIKYLYENGTSQLKISKIINTSGFTISQRAISEVLKTCSGEKGETPDISN